MAPHASRDANGHRERVLWPDDGLTRGDLIDYLTRIADAMLPHCRDRPATFVRFPRGIDGKSFYQRELPEHAPETMGHVPYETATNRHVIELPIVNVVDDLVWLAESGVIEFHLWNARAAALDEPDIAIMDLDAGPSASFASVLAAASIIRDELASLDLDARAKTSGGRGIHVYVPLGVGHTHAGVRDWVEAFGQRMAARHPEIFTTSKGGTHLASLVTIDYAQNSLGRNTAAPYTPRARAGAPVSMPLSWDEVATGGFVPENFNLNTAPARVEHVGDLFAPVLGGNQQLPPIEPD